MLFRIRQPETFGWRRRTLRLITEQREKGIARRKQLPR
jgi:hypothetical protein